MRNVLKVQSSNFQFPVKLKLSLQNLTKNFASNEQFSKIQLKELGVLTLEDSWKCNLLMMIVNRTKSLLIGKGNKRKGHCSWARIPSDRHWTPPYHNSRVFPFGQLVEDPQEVDAREQIAPAVRKTGTDLQRFGRQFWLVANDTRRKVQDRDADRKRERERERERKRNSESETSDAGKQDIPFRMWLQ